MKPSIFEYLSVHVISAFAAGIGGVTGDQHPAPRDQDSANSSCNILLQKWNGRLSPPSSPLPSQEVEVSLEIWREHKNNIGDEKTDPCSKLAMLDPSLSSGDVSGKYLSILDSALRGEGLVRFKHMGIFYYLDIWNLRVKLIMNIDCLSVLAFSLQDLRYFPSVTCTCLLEGNN